MVMEVPKSDTDVYIDIRCTAKPLQNQILSYKSQRLPIIHHSIAISSRFPTSLGVAKTKRTHLRENEQVRKPTQT